MRPPQVERPVNASVEARRERARRRTQRERRVGAAGAGVVMLVGAAFVLTQLGGSETVASPGSTKGSHQAQKPAQLPRGGRVLLPDYRVVALYGAPQDDQLG